MMVRIRMQRHGANKAPFYRIVVTDSRNPRDGRFIEIIGTYDPRKAGEQFTIDEEKALKWLSQGAQPTDTVKSMFKKLGINEKAKAAKESK
ncbi:MAG: 30S ribosomal protein S16 [Bacilli bacterium]|nr:30S ribosomal protein S16 [Bacilli bacterium]